ncbi:MAG: hypothetical protein ACLTZP_06700, partial [Acutalibacteraceae bacterium]
RASVTENSLYYCVMSNVCGLPSRAAVGGSGASSRRTLQRIVKSKIAVDFCSLYDNILVGD